MIRKFVFHGFNPAFVAWTDLYSTALWFLYKFTYDSINLYTIINLYCLVRGPPPVKSKSLLRFSIRKSAIWHYSCLLKNELSGASIGERSLEQYTHLQWLHYRTCFTRQLYGVACQNHFAFNYNIKAKVSPLNIDNIQLFLSLQSWQDTGNLILVNMISKCP